MIDVKYLQLIVDDERKCSGMVISNELALIQTHLIPLIDASASGNAKHEKPAVALFKCAGETR